MLLRKPLARLVVHPMTGLPTPSHTTVKHELRGQDAWVFGALPPAQENPQVRQDMWQRERSASAPSPRRLGEAPGGRTPAGPDDRPTCHASPAQIARLGTRPGGAEALNNFGLVMQDLRQPDQSITAHRAAARICRLSGDRQDEGNAPSNVGIALQQADRNDEAITASEDATATCRETGNRHGQASTLSNLGRLPRGLTSIQAMSPGASGFGPGRECNRTALTGSGPNAT